MTECALSGVAVDCNRCCGPFDSKVSACCLVLHYTVTLVPRCHVFCSTVSFARCVCVFSLVLRLIDTLVRSICVVFGISYYFELYFQQFVPCSIKSISKPARVVVNRTGTVVSIRRTRFVLNCE